jgi:hypothetical protein
MNKQKCYAWVLGFATTISITACHEDIGISGGGSVGKIAPHIELNTTVESSKKSASRAETGITANDLALKITAEDGSYSGSWNSLSDFPSDNTFAVGNYLVEALYGSVETEGFESPAYYGSQNITVHEDETTDVSLTATLANTMLSVDYTDAFKNYMTSWSAEAHSAGGEYIYFTQDETRPAYMRPGTVTLNVEFTKPNGTSAKLQVAQFNGVARHHYHMTVDIENGAGDAVLKVIYDDALDTETVEIDLSDELLNAPAPEITGEGMVNGSLISHFEGDEITQSLKANIVARGTIAGATLTTQSTDLIAAGWPAEIDLVAATSAQQATLKSLGLNVVGLYKNPEKMALIDFTQVLNHTYNAVFTLEVRDVYGKVSDAFSFSIKVEEMQLAIVSASKFAYDADELTFQLQYNGSNKQAINVKYINELGVYQDATITNIADTDTNGVYDVTFTTGTSLSSVQFYATVAGKQTAAYTVQRADIPVTVAAADVDVYATKATVTGTINDAEEVSSPKLAYRVKGASSWTEATTTESGTALSASLTGLSDNTTYELAAINSGKVVSAIKTFTTEEAAQLPNSDMEDWYRESGKTSYWWIDYPGKTTASGTTVWGTMNLLTTSEGGSAGAPGCGYAAKSGTTNVTGDDAYDGTSALVQTVGWGSGNTAWNNKIATGSTLGIPNGGACNNLTVGQLYLGSYNSSTLLPDYGMTFSSRPSSLSFYYKYVPKNSADYGVAEIHVLDASGAVIAETTQTLSTVSSYTKVTLSLTYGASAKKAASLQVTFKSSGNSDCQTISNDNLSSPPSSTVTTAQGYIGSKLYVDNLSLNY